MKLKGRIAVAFTLVLVLPLVLITISVYTIFHVRYEGGGRSFNKDRSAISVVSNPVEYVNRRIRPVYNEISLCISNTPMRLEQTDYLDTLSAKLSGSDSVIVVEKNGKVTYNKDEELFERAEAGLKHAALTMDSADNGNYFGDTGVLVKKLTYALTDGSTGAVFIITDMTHIEENANRGLTSLVISIVIIMLLTACGLAIWLYRGILKPIASLRESTKRIKAGDLDTPIKVYSNDEIGELCTDFDSMREHIKDLLAENHRHEVDTRDLIVNISHDLKTPLTAIKGYAEGLLAGVARTPEKQEKYVRTIYTKAGDMTTLIDELSTYAKIDTNSIPYNFLNINIYDYFEHAISEIRTDMELQNMDLAFFPYADRTVEVISDPEQLRRVVNNIISNALKYRDPAKKGIICIRLIDAEDYIRVEIEDNGKGISAKSLPYIFDRFYRADASRNSKIGGSGLGLAISKKIIEDSGGRLWAESREGVGTTLIFMLRKTFISVESTQKKAQPLMLESSGETGRSQKKKHIRSIRQNKNSGGNKDE